MSCKFDKEIIQKYVDNVIDPLEQIFLKEHVKFCEECRNEIELLMTVERELDDFFNNSVECKDLEFIINSVVDDCIKDIEKRNVLKLTIQSGKKIASNSVKFITFIPGSRYVKKGLKTVAAKSGSLVSSVVRKQVRKLITNI
jgi:hypothetical protein